MRNPRNETAGVTLPSRAREGSGEGLSGLVPDAHNSSPSPSRKREGDQQHTPERTCVLSRRKGSKDELIRLALSPEGEVAPDVRARAPGRGAWIGVTRQELDAANAKGRLKGALQRAFKTNDVKVPADLGDHTAAALRQAALDRLGMEARAGNLVNGAERVEAAARTGKVHFLIHAADAGEDGCKRLDQAWRVGGGEPRGVIFPENRTILSLALGRENVVHLALTDPAAASRVRHALERWRAFTGPERGPGGGEPALGLGSAEEDLTKE
jgi:predicted RNA-binding protein YlxR (DUF448 family)